MRALLSVFDKSGLEHLARGLDELGWELVSSGGTSEALARAGIPHREVAEVTGAPEMLGGRVKTLHPAIAGGILADRDDPAHVADLERRGIEPFDLVVCNLYPFPAAPSVEMIDIGGPTMVRAAAKNYGSVGVVVDPGRYPAVLAELRGSGFLSEDTRRDLARAAFAHVAAYDAAIVEWFDAARGAGAALRAAAGPAPGEAGAGQGPLPSEIRLTLERAGSLRYGENPHQRGARYRIAGRWSWWDEVVQHGGTQLSYLNIFDADAAWRLVHELAEPDDGARAVVIVKHANPSGAAVAGDLATAYRLALECDEQSAFGGIVAVGGPVDEEVAEAVAAGPQADVIVATSFSEGARDRLATRRKATRLISGPAPEPIERQYRGLGAAMLVQDPDRFRTDRSQWEVVTKAAPTEDQWVDLRMAWTVCGRTTSNAVAVVRGRQAVGVGAGQPSRVVAAELAVAKAGPRAAGAAAASDAFFPFPDGLLVLVRAGVAAVVQPGGSIRDGDLIAAADDAGVAMVMASGERHFRH